MRSLGGREALRYHNGYRTWKLSYGDLYRRVAGFAGYLEKHHLHKGERIVLWGENRPAWAAAFWGCVVRGVEVVPLDFRSSAEFVKRIQGQVESRLLLFGNQVDASGLEGPRLSFDEVEALADETLGPAEISPDDVVEIVFTSGTTGQPKGVVHRHRNICANLRPIRREINRFRALARPFQPVRLLNLLPLSHMFGQTAGLFLPPLLGGGVVFTDDFHPAALLDSIRRERISALIAVPGLLRNLQAELERRFALAGRAPCRNGLLGAAQRWWRYRDVHRLLGWKFWSFVVGGAQLGPELEEFWRRLGYVVVQGYGLTESSPVVAINHPFSTRRGSIGKALEGQEVKLAPDGEILVRGPSVVSDYVGGGADAATRLEGGWLHTGDIAEVDAEGLLYFRGRKKEVIVTADGLNVFPQDVEAILDRYPEVKESAVVGLPRGGEERVHAVLVLRNAQASPESLVRRANSELEPHQRIRGWSLWPDEKMPRTPSTLKIKRAEITRRLSQGQAETPPRAAEMASGVRSTLAAMTGRAPESLAVSTRLAEDLGLSSLERVDLLARLEDAFGVALDEEQFAGLTTVGQLEDWQPVSGLPAVPPTGGGGAIPGPSADVPQEPTVQVAASKSSAITVTPRWTRRAPVRWSRRVLLDTGVLPAFREMVRLRGTGLENLECIERPVIFAANHASHFDTVAVLAALPSGWRRWIAPAMSQDYFRGYFQPEGLSWQARIQIAAQYYLACGLFNAYPLPQRMGGTRRALKYTGELVSEGYCPLVFPEGLRTPSGRMQPFKTGIGLMAARLRVTIIPAYIAGTYQVYSVRHEWPQPGDVRVCFGAPLLCRAGADYAAVAGRVEAAIRELALSHG